MWLLNYTELSLSESIPLRVFVNVKLPRNISTQHEHFFENTHNFHHLHPSPSLFLLCRCNIEKEDWKGKLKYIAQHKHFFENTPNFHHLHPSPSFFLLCRWSIEREDWKGRLRKKIEVYCTAQAFLWKYSQFSPSPSISIILFVMQVQLWEGRLRKKIEVYCRIEDWSILQDWRLKED